MREEEKWITAGFGDQLFVGNNGGREVKDIT